MCGWNGACFEWRNVDRSNSDRTTVPAHWTNGSNVGKSRRKENKMHAAPPPSNLCVHLLHQQEGERARCTPYQWCHWEPMRACGGTCKRLSSAPPPSLSAWQPTWSCSITFYTMLLLCCRERQQHRDVVLGWALPSASEQLVSVCKEKIHRAVMTFFFYIHDSPTNLFILHRKF